MESNENLLGCGQRGLGGRGGSGGQRGLGGWPCGFVEQISRLVAPAVLGEQMLCL